MLLLMVLMAGEKLQLIQGVSGSMNDRLDVKAGGLVAREGEPAAAFNTVRVGKGKVQAGYFVVIRHGLGGSGKSESNERVDLEDRKATSKHTLTLDGKTMVIGHVVEVGPDGKVKRETVTIDGKDADPAKGRVFVADLTASPTKWEQKKLVLPAELEDVSTEKGAADLARTVLADLAKQDKKVKAFLEGK